MTAFASTVSHPIHPVSYHGGESVVSRIWSSIVTRMVKLSISDDEVIVENDSKLPDWVIPTIFRLYALQQLPENWDSYGGVPLHERHRDAVLRFLGSVMSDDIVPPDIVPLADGGVQLEWRRGDLEVDFISDEELSEPTLFVTRGDDSEEIEGLQGVRYFLNELREALRIAEGVAA